MVFNSYIFILCFLPLSLIGYYLLGKIDKPPVLNWWLVLVSFIFYAYIGFYMLAYPLISCGFNFFCSKFIQKKGIEYNSSKITMWFAVIVNILSLCLFKYFPIKNIFVPLGISFITFGQIAYIVDTYKGKTFGDSLSEYLLYICWFPKVTQGPLLKHDDFVVNLRKTDRSIVNYENLSEGFFCFVVGLFKKMFIADSIAKAVDYLIQFPNNLGTKSALLLILGYSLQIYMDFSAYSDMAVGVSKLFNIQLPINFNSPYKALSITDFWKRWHISLTDFLREYVYFPLGGSRKGKGRTYLNILIVYIISGLWHGNTFTFLIWGLFHGIFQVIERAFNSFFVKIPKIIRASFTFIIVSVGWLLFRVNNLNDFVLCIKSLFRKDDFIVWTESFKMADFFGANEFFDSFGRIGNLIQNNTSILILLIGLFICFFCPNLYEKKRKYTGLLAVVSSILFIFEIVSLSGTMTTFIYFNF